MAPERCQHPNRARGVVHLDFVRETPDHSIYSVETAVDVCEECGHIDLYAKFHHPLCDWLKQK
jgi:hypothetical protein